MVAQTFSKEPRRQLKLPTVGQVAINDKYSVRKNKQHEIAGDREYLDSVSKFIAN